MRQSDMLPIPHAVGVSGVPVIHLGLQDKVFELSAQLASAHAQIAGLRALVDALREEAAAQPKGDAT